mmetsp:Transcript_53612/g.153887  ORF Transcript_53612/g.153887 Transcript_53612/m.153887 type:complete len:212 (+) Transcript_53612:1584-2219(+)
MLAKQRCYEFSARCDAAEQDTLGKAFQQVRNAFHVSNGFQLVAHVTEDPSNAIPAAAPSPLRSTCRLCCWLHCYRCGSKCFWLRKSVGCRHSRANTNWGGSRPWCARHCRCSASAPRCRWKGLVCALPLGLVWDQGAVVLHVLSLHLFPLQLGSLSRRLPVWPLLRLSHLLWLRCRSRPWLVRSGDALRHGAKLGVAAHTRLQEVQRALST